MKIYTKLFLAFIFFTTAFAGAYLDLPLQASSRGDSVTLEWKTGKEENVQKFVIMRKTPQSSYIEIKTVVPKGSGSFYQIVDEDIYKTADMIFNYQLKIVDNNQQVTTSNEVTVTLNGVSGVKQTWGSIKAMFR